MTWQKHKESILFNKNLLIADTCSLFISALLAQVLYLNLDENNILDSIITAAIEYCIDTPIFLFLYFADHSNKLGRIGSQPKYIIKRGDILRETRHLLGIFAACDIMYVIIKIAMQIQLLNLGLQPYQAALFSSLFAWVIYLILINITLKATRIFSKDELIWYYSLILVVSVANSIIFFSNLNLRVFLDNIILDISAAVAVIAAIIVILKIYTGHRVRMPLTKRVFPAILIGLILWFTAEMTWTYYQVVLGIDNPFPSIADAFWLAGYIPFGFALYSIYGNILQTGKKISNKLSCREHYLFAGFLSIAAIIIVIFTYMGIAILYPKDISLFPLSPEEFQNLILALAYPVFDVILLVPVVTILWTLKRVDILHTHWILLCSFVILEAFGDIGFAYAELIYHIGAENNVWLWDAFFNSAYICLAAALLWYRKFNIPLYEPLKKEPRMST